jgi:hypothetical protein
LNNQRLLALLTVARSRNCRTGCVRTLRSG